VRSVFQLDSERRRRLDVPHHARINLLLQKFGVPVAQPLLTVARAILFNPRQKRAAAEPFVLIERVP
jgi:hypothetical protein